ncbi:MAG: decaprenyl-phosphate phosphoribosyltransferase [Propionibacteriaceae bacterium]|jgi:decaprenyl-phosphate phosphoribosyltransferase|nr:decaprenyl-phosphate phosphoribosyltransferase [Propionibacteriaceae bacterium]
MTEIAFEPKKSRLPAWLRALRPKQWVKNILVFTAPLAAGRLTDLPVLGACALAFATFCLISSSVYLINDVRDAEADRQHPRKRFRPIAAKELAVKPALALAALLGLAALGLAWMVAPLLFVTIAFYWVLQIGYSIFLKHQPILDLAVVAAGFLLRAVAGGVASGVPLSQWFLLVASFGSLFMVAGKRYSELKTLGGELGTRPSLGSYSLSYLNMVWMVSVAVVIVCYGLWAFEQRGSQLWGVAWNAISIAPFTLAILRYAMAIDAGRAGEPEEVVMSDRVLQALAALWIAPVAISVFA